MGLLQRVVLLSALGGLAAAEDLFGSAGDVSVAALLKPACRYGAWQDAGACSVSCGGGKLQQLRAIAADTPTNCKHGATGLSRTAPAPCATVPCATGTVSGIAGAAAAATAASFSTSSLPSDECIGGFVKDGAELARFAGCRVLHGYLAIVGAPWLLDLSPLATLQEIRALPATHTSAPGGNGLVIASNVRLKSITALGALTAVSGGISIEDNAALTSLAGLNVGAVGANNGGNSYVVRRNALLRDLGVLWGRAAGSNDSSGDDDGGGSERSNSGGTLSGGLAISGNPSLTQVDALAAVQRIGGDLVLANNTALTSLDGLGGVTAVEGGLVLEGNTALATLDGLGSLGHLGATAHRGGGTARGTSLHVLRNEHLHSIAGLRALQGLLAGAVTIASNPALVSLAGLEAVSGLGRDGNGVSLALDGNDALASTEALRGLQGVLGGSVVVLANPSLRVLAGLQAVSELGVDVRGDSVVVKVRSAAASFQFSSSRCCCCCCCVPPLLCRRCCAAGKEGRLAGQRSPTD